MLCVYIGTYAQTCQHFSAITLTSSPPTPLPLIPVLLAGYPNAKISAGVGFVLGYHLTAPNLAHVSSLILNPTQDGRFEECGWGHPYFVTAGLTPALPPNFLFFLLDWNPYLRLESPTLALNIVSIL